MWCQNVLLPMVDNLLANTSSVSMPRANEEQSRISIILGKEPYLMERAEKLQEHAFFFFFLNEVKIILKITKKEQFIDIKI